VSVAFEVEGGIEGAATEFGGNCKGGSALTTVTIKSRRAMRYITLFVPPRVTGDKQFSIVVVKSNCKAQACCHESAYAEDQSARFSRVDDLHSARVVPDDLQ